MAAAVLLLVNPYPINSPVRFQRVPGLRVELGNGLSEIIRIAARLSRDVFISLWRLFETWMFLIRHCERFPFSCIIFFGLSRLGFCERLLRRGGPLFTFAWTLKSCPVPLPARPAARLAPGDPIAGVIEHDADRFGSVAVEDQRAVRRGDDGESHSVISNCKPVFSAIFA